MNMKDFRRARKRVEVSVGESVRIVRELQGLTQNGLSKLTGIVHLFSVQKAWMRLNSRGCVAP